MGNRGKGSASPDQGGKDLITVPGKPARNPSEGRGEERMTKERRSQKNSTGGKRERCVWARDSTVVAIRSRARRRGELSKLIGERERGGGGSKTKKKDEKQRGREGKSRVRRNHRR